MQVTPAVPARGAGWRPQRWQQAHARHLPAAKQGAPRFAGGAEMLGLVQGRPAGTLAAGGRGLLCHPPARLPARPPTHSLTLLVHLSTTQVALSLRLILFAFSWLMPMRSLPSTAGRGRQRAGHEGGAEAVDLSSLCCVAAGEASGCG